MSLTTITVMSCVLTAVTWSILAAFIVVLVRYGSQGVRSMIDRVFNRDDDVINPDNVPQRKRAYSARSQSVKSGDVLRQRAQQLEFPSPAVSGQAAQFEAQNAPQSRFGNVPQANVPPQTDNMNYRQQGRSVAPGQPTLSNRSAGQPSQTAPNYQQGPATPSLSPSRPFSGDPLRPPNPANTRPNPPAQAPRHNPLQQRPQQGSPPPQFGAQQETTPQRTPGSLQQRPPQGSMPESPPPPDSLGEPYRPDLRDNPSAHLSTGRRNYGNRGRDSRKGDDYDRIYDDNEGGEGGGFFDGLFG